MFGRGLGCRYISDIRFGMRRPGTALESERHLCWIDYTRYPPEESEKLYEYLFGEATVFYDHIKATRKFLEAIII